MKKSLIVYTYNSEKYIGKLLKSILEQIDETEQELIIVDDLSTDNTVPIIVDTIVIEGAPESEANENELNNLSLEEHYKFYINSTQKGKRKSVEMAKKIALGDFKFIINKRKRVKI